MAELLEGEAITIDAPGYIIVYVNNNSIGKDVYFDNINIEHYAGILLEENHYYPYGLTVSQVASGATAPENPYKFGTKELESSFGLNSYDFIDRAYNMQTGRFTQLDRKAAKMPGISPYAYALNNPVMFIDPDGQYPLTFHIRSFAPFETFGANNWVGDNRGFTTNANVTSRLAQITSYETTTQKFSSRAIGSTSAGIYGGNPVVGFSEGRVQGGQDGKGNGVGNNIVTHLSGNDDAVVRGLDGTFVENAQSPDIDVHSQFSITEGPVDADGNSLLTISGKMSGDAFPSAEAFVSDSKGNKVFMGVSPAQYGPNKGPFYALLGDNKRPMANLQVSISVNKDGVFRNVNTISFKNGKAVINTMSIIDWNKQFENKSAQ